MTDTPAMMLRIARSFAATIKETGKKVDDQFVQELSAKLLAGLTLKLSESEAPTPRKYFALYWHRAGGHTHVDIFSGGPELGQRGKAGSLALRNEEWDMLAYCLDIVQVLMPGVFKLIEEEHRGK